MRIPDNKEFFRVDEVAEITGFTEKTVYEWIRLEKLKASRFPGNGSGSDLRIHRDDLLKFCGLVPTKRRRVIDPGVGSGSV